MHYKDEIYGSYIVDEPVLLEVIRTSAMQRLHRVLQHGISGLIGITRPSTRYEHSVGVMLLVRQLGGPIEEQIASLLHDISHTAFSHVIDYVFDGHESQSYHDEVKEEYLAKTDIPDVLARHGYNWHLFLDEKQFPLLEQPAPALCADRLDYFLRDSKDLGLASDNQIGHVLDHLVVRDRRIVVGDLDAARWLAYTYIAADGASWANFREVGLYELTAQAIKSGLDIGAITKDDLWTGDQEVWAKLHASANADLHKNLELIAPETRFVWDDSKPDFRVGTKLRTIDPDVLVGSEIKALSGLDANFARHRSAYLLEKQGRWPIRIVPG